MKYFILKNVTDAELSIDAEDGLNYKIDAQSFSEILSEEILSKFSEEIFNFFAEETLELYCSNTMYCYSIEHCINITSSLKADGTMPDIAFVEKGFTEVGKRVFCSSGKNQIEDNIYCVDIVLDSHNQNHQRAIENFAFVIHEDENTKENISSSLKKEQLVIEEDFVREMDDREKYQSTIEIYLGKNKLIFTEQLKLGCTTSVRGIKMDCGYTHKSNLEVALRASQSQGNETRDIIDFDNQIQTVTLEELSIIIGDLCVHADSLFFKKQERKALLYAAKSTTEAEEILTN